MPTDITNPNTLRSLRTALRELTDIDPEMPIQYIVALVAVGLREGITVTELGEEMHMSQSSASRAVAVWCSIDGKKKYDKRMELREGATDRRVKHLHLTPDGKRLLNKLIGYFA